MTIPDRRPTECYISLNWFEPYTTPIRWTVGLYRIYFFPIRPEPDFVGFGMTNPAGAGTGAGFSNW